jgi:large subunit ribosomal protein L21
VIGEVVEHPSEKYFIQHFRRRKNSRRFKGHRQHHTQVRVKHILLPGQQAPAESTPAASAPAAAPK